MILQNILGDADAVSMMLARITASGALSEFIFNPLFGRAMDTHGRKPFLVGAMLASAFAYGLAFLNAGNGNFYLIETIIRKAADTGTCATADFTSNGRVFRPNHPKRHLFLM